MNVDFFFFFSSHPHREFSINFNLLCALLVLPTQHLTNRAAKYEQSDTHSMNFEAFIHAIILNYFFAHLQLSLVSFIWWLMMIVYESASLSMVWKRMKSFSLLRFFFYSWKTMWKEIKVLHCNFHFSRESFERD